MTAGAETVAEIVAATAWDQRVARIRQIPQHHGTDEHPAIYAEVARRVYVTNLAPDFAYVHEADFYELPHFLVAYEKAARGTAQFGNVAAADLEEVLRAEPMALLVFRTITGLTKSEFAASTNLIAEPLGLASLSPSKVDSMERRGTRATATQARVAALTIDSIIAGTLFGEPPGTLKSKQDKPDTTGRWDTVREFARHGVPYSHLLHQRHSGGSFGQVLNATSTRRGDLIEDAVEALFDANGIAFIRTGSNNQAEIERRFEVAVRPAPDFVVFDGADSLRGLLECKGANDGGTARDKARRFAALREESIRLGGTPLFAVLGGLGWTRVNDALGPVVRDCDGRVFTLANLEEILTVQPFPQLRSPG